MYTRTTHRQTDTHTHTHLLACSIKSFFLSWNVRLQSWIVNALLFFEDGNDVYVWVIKFSFWGGLRVTILTLPSRIFVTVTSTLRVRAEINIRNNLKFWIIDTNEFKQTFPCILKSFLLSRFILEMNFGTYQAKQKLFLVSCTKWVTVNIH